MSLQLPRKNSLNYLSKEMINKNRLQSHYIRMNNNMCITILHKVCCKQ